MTARRLRKMTSILMLAAVAAFIGAAACIAIAGLADRTGRADVIVVFGNKVNPDGQPSPRLKARLDKAAQLFRRGLSTAVIVSGGVDPQGFDEAAVMSAYLVRAGIPEDCVHQDNRGIDTYNTARNTAALMRRKGWKSVIVVSQYFHIVRARLAFHRFGIEPVYSAHADYYAPRDLYSLAREVVALIAYLFRGYSPSAPGAGAGGGEGIGP